MPFSRKFQVHLIWSGSAVPTGIQQRSIENAHCNHRCRTTKSRVQYEKAFINLNANTNCRTHFQSNEMRLYCCRMYTPVASLQLNLSGFPIFYDVHELAICAKVYPPVFQRAGYTLDIPLRNLFLSLYLVSRVRMMIHSPCSGEKVIHDIVLASGPRRSQSKKARHKALHQG
jgi:hypothetical protein